MVDGSVLQDKKKFQPVTATFILETPAEVEMLFQMINYLGDNNEIAECCRLADMEMVGKFKADLYAIFKPLSGIADQAGGDW